MKLCTPKSKIYYDWIHILDFYKRVVREQDTVLEIGASNKKRTIDLGKHCKKLIGVECFPERTLEDFNNIKYINGDWQKLTDFIPKNSIDVAVSSHVIEHVKDDLTAINQLYTVLKPGGTAIINTPNRRRLTQKTIELFTGERKFPYWEHVREYIEDDLIELILNSKFKDNFEIHPVVFGLHGGPIFIFIEKPPKKIRHLSNFWQIHLFKQKTGFY